MSIGGRAQEPGVDVVARRCGYLPLALRVTGRLFVEEGTLLEVEDWLRRMDRTGLPEVTASIQLSLDGLPAGAAGLWEGLGVFVGGFDREAACAVWGEEDRDEGLETMGRLVQHNLVGLEGKVYRLHDLAREVARGRLARDGRWEELRIACCDWGLSILSL